MTAVMWRRRFHCDCGGGYVGVGNIADTLVRCLSSTYEDSGGDTQNDNNGILYVLLLAYHYSFGPSILVLLC